MRPSRRPSSWQGLRVLLCVYVWAPLQIFFFKNRKNMELKCAVVACAGPWREWGCGEDGQLGLDNSPVTPQACSLLHSCPHCLL